MLDRILLIDDDPDELILFEEALHGVSLFPILYYAENGLEALNKLTNAGMEPPQIIFSDINMPVMSGWRFLRRIKTYDIFKHIPVIIYSTSSNKKEVAQALELGAAYFFTKPFCLEQLKYKLEVILEIFVPRHKEIS